MLQAFRAMRCQQQKAGLEPLAGRREEGYLKTADVKMKLLFVFGAGYSATTLARQIDPAQWRVMGSNRTPLSPEITGTGGATAGTDDPVGRVQWVPGMPWPDAAIAADALLFSIPPGEEGDDALAALPSGGVNARWAGYLSTTGVYGDLAGGWAFEENLPRPRNAQALRRVKAEQQALAGPLPMHVFRLPGIYGPGRSALDRLRAGRMQSLVKPGHVFSRVHVDDIAGALIHSIAAPEPGRIYNIADDLPCAQTKVLNFAADLLGLPLPEEIPFDAAELSPGAERFWSESRRVSNARIKAALGVQLRFPDYVSGLRAIHAAEFAAARAT